jgi:hypothetical protein
MYISIMAIFKAIRFKSWMESVILEQEKPLRREQQQQVEKIYNQVIQLLLGGAKDQTHLSLSEIEDDSSTSERPPSPKGAMVVLKKLEKNQIFNQIDKLQIPSLTQRSHEVQTYLQKIANDQKVGPKDTVGGLLNKLFGDNAVELYGKGRWKSAPTAPSQKPDGNAKTQMTPDATAPPTEDPGVNPAANPMPTPSPGAPMPGMPPMPQGGQMPPMPGMPPMPQDPTQPLQSPGGPMPPMPPGGMF